ncbi:hypothetical protein A7K94_0208765, partial [Modestobacter sp. VKM Ac-2676]
MTAMSPDGAAPPADLLRQAVEAMPRPLFVLDHDWRFSYVNPAGARLLRRRVGDLLGRVIWAEFPEAVGSEFARQYEHVARTGEPVAFESWYPPLRTWFHVDAPRGRRPGGHLRRRHRTARG